MARVAVLLASMAAAVAGHGYVKNAIIGGKNYPGFVPASSSNGATIAWAAMNGDTANASIYDSPDVICQKAATPGTTHATLAAGDSVTLEWTPWSHKGPVVNYLANCQGDCERVDKTKLQFFKIAEAGVIDGLVNGGTWASDALVANQSSWTVAIPTNIAAGNYVLRHEIIALHSAGEPQNYMQVSREITSCSRGLFRADERLAVLQSSGHWWRHGQPNGCSGHGTLPALRSELAGQYLRPDNVVQSPGSSPDPGRSGGSFHEW